MYVKWKLPSLDSIMLNTNVTFKLGTNYATIAGVFRNPNGAWILGFINHISATDSLEAETHALLLGLSVASEYRFHLLEISLNY